jgi:hypothetical protein
MTPDPCNKKKLKTTQKYELYYDLELVMSTIMQKKKNLKLRSDLILYPQSYINNLEIILSIITSSIKTFQTYIIVRTVKKKKA